MIADLPAVDDFAEDICVCRLANLQPELAVVNQHRISCLEFLRQIRVGNAAAMRVAKDISRRQSEHFSVLELRLAAREISGADLRSLGIQHDCRGQPHRVPHAAEQIDGFTMTCMISMRKIHSRHIHARFQHGANDFFFGGCRS